MPLLRLDAAPAFDLSLLPDDVRHSWVRTASGVMRPREEATAASAGAPSRPQPGAEPRGAPSSTALALVSGGTATRGPMSSALVVNTAAVEAAQRAVAAQAIAKPSSAAEIAAFTAAYRKNKPQRLFASNKASDEPAAGADVAPEPVPVPVPVDESKPAAAAAPTAEIDAEVDYQGRGFLHYSEQLHPVRSTPKATVPTKLVHVYRGHNAGVHALEWFPTTQHLLLSSDLAGEVMLWDVLAHKRRVGVYRGHTDAVRSVSFAPDGLRFTTAGMDGLLRQWDTETGQVSATLTYKDAPFATHACHPRRGDLVLCGAGKLVLQWDMRSGKVVREYDAHQASVLHVGFLPNSHFFASTSEDKTVRTWDVDASVTVQDIADAVMDAVPHFACHPHDGHLALQSLSNRVIVMQPVKTPGKFKALQDRALSGHTVSGSSCRVAFSGDGRYVSSGTISGELHVWDWQTSELVKKFRAHAKPLNAHLWHPRDLSRVVTAGWDGVIKMFAPG
jgi:pre-mRNA-processing factor 17